MAGSKGQKGDELPRNGPSLCEICFFFFFFVYFAPPLKVFPLELDTGTRGQNKTRMMGLPGRERSLTISSAVWIQSINVTDRRTDRQTPGDSKDR